MQAGKKQNQNPRRRFNHRWHGSIFFLALVGCVQRVRFHSSREGRLLEASAVARESFYKARHGTARHTFLPLHWLGRWYCCSVLCAARRNLLPCDRDKKDGLPKAIPRRRHASLVRSCREGIGIFRKPPASAPKKRYILPCYTDAIH